MCSKRGTGGRWVWRTRRWASRRATVSLGRLPCDCTMLGWYCRLQGLIRWKCWTRSEWIWLGCSCLTLPHLVKRSTGRSLVGRRTVCRSLSSGVSSHLHFLLDLKGLKKWLDRVAWVVSTYVEQRKRLADISKETSVDARSEEKLRENYNFFVRNVGLIFDLFYFKQWFPRILLFYLPCNKVVHPYVATS